MKRKLGKKPIDAKKKEEKLGKNSVKPRYHRDSGKKVKKKKRPNAWKI